MGSEKSPTPIERGSADSKHIQQLAIGVLQIEVVVAGALVAVVGSSPANVSQGWSIAAGIAFVMSLVAIGLLLANIDVPEGSGRVKKKDLARSARRNRLLFRFALGSFAFAAAFTAQVGLTLLGT